MQTLENKPDKSALKIIYMGTPDFAVPGLELLHAEGYHISAVITAPDKPAGRGLIPTFSPVKKCALELGLKILQPEKLKDPAFLEDLESLKADLQIVVAFRMLPEAVWNMPRLGTFNLHASLLPQYRGAAPIHWAIIQGEKKTGLTTFFLKHEIDTGDLLLQEEEPILPEDTVGTLYERLMNKGAGLILKSVQLIETGNYQTIPQQNIEHLKIAPKIHKETCDIDWHQKGEKVYDFVRGLNPFPCAYTHIAGIYCKVFHGLWVLEEQQTISVGQVDTDGKNYLRIGTEDGYFEIQELQLEGKKRMKTADLLRGFKFPDIS